MPYCSYCKRWIDRWEPRYRCTGCRRFFCEHCGRMLKRGCLICSGVAEMAEKSGLKHYIPA